MIRIKIETIFKRNVNVAVFMGQFIWRLIGRLIVNLKRINMHI